MVSSNNSKSKQPRTAHCVVLTIHDGTSSNHDTGGKLIESLLHEKGHEVVYRRVVKHSSAAIREAIAEALADEECEVVVTNGGTGLTHKDETFETLSDLYEKRVAGFGEVFNTLAYSEMGASCLLYRPSAGVIEKHPVFSLPDDHTAIRIGMEKLVLPELGTILTELQK